MGRGYRACACVCRERERVCVCVCRGGGRRESNTLLHSFTHSLTPSLTHSLLHSFTDTHTLTPSLTHSLTHSFTPSLTHTHTHTPESRRTGCAGTLPVHTTRRHLRGAAELEWRAACPTAAGRCCSCGPPTAAAGRQTQKTAGASQMGAAPASYHHAVPLPQLQPLPQPPASQHTQRAQPCSSLWHNQKKGAG